MRFTVLALAALAVSQANGAHTARSTLDKLKQFQTMTEQAASVGQTLGSKIPKLPSIDKPSVVLQDASCQAHSHCGDAGEMYCNTDNTCLSCCVCQSRNNSITGSCPVCNEECDGEDLDLATLICVAQNTGPCLDAMFSGALDFDNGTAEEAMTALAEFCTNCTDAAAEIQATLEACNATDSAFGEIFIPFGSFADAACEEPECSASVFWAFNDLENRHDTFCENQECGIFEALLTEESEEEMISAECIGEFLGFACLKDENSGDACVDLAPSFFGPGSEEGGEFSVAPFCDSTCAVSLTSAFMRLEELECGLGETDNGTFSPGCEDLDFDFVMLDFCTANGNGDYCVDLMVNEEGPNECDMEGDMVPAPGGEPTCPEACADALNEYTDTLGCCATWSLDISCAPDSIRDFIVDDCGATLPDTCDRPVLPASAGGAASTTLSAVAGLAIGVAAAASMLSLA